MKFYSHEINEITDTFFVSQLEALDHLAETAGVLNIGIREALENGGTLETSICDNEWQEFDVTFIASGNDRDWETKNVSVISLISCE